MESITSLILLVALILPPLFLAGREIIYWLFIDETRPLFGKRGEQETAPGHITDAEWETPPMYDGMITVEIPVSDPQVIAYEPPGQEDEEEIIVLGPVSRVTRAGAG